jgi:hypothetical protein
MLFKYLGRIFIRILTNWFCCLLIYAMCFSNVIKIAIKRCLYCNRFPNREVPKPLTLLNGHLAIFDFDIGHPCTRVTPQWHR